MFSSGRLLPSEGAPFFVLGRCPPNSLCLRSYELIPDVGFCRMCDKFFRNHVSWRKVGVGVDAPSAIFATALPKLLSSSLPLNTREVMITLTARSSSGGYGSDRARNLYDSRKGPVQSL